MVSHWNFDKLSFGKRDCNKQRSGLQLRQCKGDIDLVFFRHVLIVSEKVWLSRESLVTSYESQLGRRVRLLIWILRNALLLPRKRRLQRQQRPVTNRGAANPRCSLLFYNRATPSTRRHLHPCRGEERSSSLTAHPRREDSGKGAEKRGRNCTSSTNIYLIST